MDKHLYIDFSHMCHRLIWSVREEIMQIQKENKNKKEEDVVDEWGLLRHVVLSSIFDFICTFRPNEVVIACDSGSSWRKTIFEPYKGNRKEKREKDEFDWSAFYTFMSKLAVEIKTTFPVYVISIPTIEADDIIAQLTIKNHHNNDITILTSDQDFFQLMRYDNVRMYDPIKSKMFTLSKREALHELEMKILTGDKSDNIPNCMPRLGPKTAEKIILNGELDNYLKDTEFKKRYDENTALIDLTKCPEDYVKQIHQYVEDYEIVGDVKNIFGYFNFNNLRDLSGRCENIGQSLKPIVEYHNRNGVKILEESNRFSSNMEVSTTIDNKFSNTKFSKLFNY